MKVSCTMSSASARLPSMRYAIENNSSRYCSKTVIADSRSSAIVSSHLAIHVQDRTAPDPVTINHVTKREPFGLPPQGNQNPTSGEVIMTDSQKIQRRIRIGNALIRFGGIVLLFSSFVKFGHAAKPV